MTMKNFKELSERGILALAISLEEEDERVYAVRFVGERSANANHARSSLSWRVALPPSLYASDSLTERLYQAFVFLQDVASAVLVTLAGTETFVRAGGAVMKEATWAATRLCPAIP